MARKHVFDDGFPDLEDIDLPFTHHLSIAQHTDGGTWCKFSFLHLGTNNVPLLGLLKDHQRFGSSQLGVNLLRWNELLQALDSVFKELINNRILFDVDVFIASELGCGWCRLHVESEDNGL